MDIRNALFAAALSASFIGCCGAALAQGAPSLPPLPEARAPGAQGGDLQACAGVADRDERIRCYDRLAGGTPPRDAATPAAKSANALPEAREPGRDDAADDPPTSGPSAEYAWAVREIMDEGGHVQVVLGMQASSVSYDGDVLAKAKATLMLRCLRGDPVAWVSFGTRAFEKMTEVGYKFDSNIMSRDRWRPSESGTSVGLWKRDTAIQLMQRLVNAKRFVFQADTADGKQYVASFELADLAEVIKPMKRECHW
jgi:type VI secretion system VasI family protein